ncbi:zona pellucida sperm-binding protein 4-like [Oncorhynchus masou masou]|uniref:zona pellucida sperm-binding protein 4-like n=1 Tax=Oncorhynchus masou masou TaxID=90313 RepID=UPI003183367B
MKWSSVCLMAVAMLIGLCDAQSVKGQNSLPTWPPAQPFPQWPAQTLPQWPTQPLPQWPAQPHPQKPAQPPQAPKLPSGPIHQGPKQTCDVEGNDKVHCGLPDITGAKCEAINCCFDGRMCFYGKAVTVQCTRDGQFVVVVARDATLPNLELDSISLLGGNEAHCTPVGITSAFAIYQFKVTECGTVMTEEPGTIFYENRMSSSYIVEMGPLGTITRGSQFNLIFQCRYRGTVIEALVIDVKQVPPPILLPAPGPLRVELRLANGICLTKGCKEEEVAYTSYYTEADYPVTKFLRDPVYAEVRILERTDPNIVLTLSRCWATTNPDPLSLPQWNLIISGCPYKDDRYLTMPIPVEASSGLSFPTHYRRFVLKMFTFVDSTSMSPLRERMFIHCNTDLCQPYQENWYCVPRCFRTRRHIANAVQKTTRSESTLVSSGELILTQIARLLAELKEVWGYWIALEFTEGSPLFGPCFSASSSRRSRGSGPVPEGDTPVIQPVRHIPLTLRADFDAELWHQIEEDIIEHIDISPWISNLDVITLLGCRPTISTKTELLIFPGKACPLKNLSITVDINSVTLSVCNEPWHDPGQHRRSLSTSKQ